MFIIRDNTGQTRRVQSLDEAALIVELDPSEIAWALDEIGVCETDTHRMVIEAKPASEEQAA